MSHENALAKQSDDLASGRYSYLNILSDYMLLLSDLGLSLCCFE